MFWFIWCLEYNYRHHPTPLSVPHSVAHYLLFSGFSLRLKSKPVLFLCLSRLCTTEPSTPFSHLMLRVLQAKHISQQHGFHSVLKAKPLPIAGSVRNLFALPNSPGPFSLYWFHQMGIPLTTLVSKTILLFSTQNSSCNLHVSVSSPSAKYVFRCASPTRLQVPESRPFLVP